MERRRDRVASGEAEPAVGREVGASPLAREEQALVRMVGKTGPPGQRDSTRARAGDVFDDRKKTARRPRADGSVAHRLGPARGARAEDGDRLQAIRGITVDALHLVEICDPPPDLLRPGAL